METSSRHGRADKYRPGQEWLLPRLEASLRRGRPSDGGFSLVEVLITLGILLLVGDIFFTVLVQTGRVTERESNRSAMISTARNGMEQATRILRSEMVQFNTVPGTPLGINFDLDQGGPLVRDGVLFYIDQNHSALLYVSGDTGQPFNAGMDDLNGDGFADLIGIGLVRQDENGDGVQDFIDVNNDGAPDDIDGDGVADPLWHLVSVRFDKVADVGNPGLWQAGRVLARNLYVRRLNPAGPPVGSNVDAIQFMAKNPTALLSDANGDGVLDENELGNVESADSIINTAAEVARVDAVIVTLHIADRLSYGGHRNLVRADLSTEIVSPRSLALYRRNGIVGLADPTDPKNIN